MHDAPSRDAGHGGFTVVGLGQRVNHLSWARVVKLLAGLMLNRTGILLQALHMAFKAAVFALQLLHLQPKVLFLFAFFRKSCHSVMSEHHPIRHAQCESASHHGSRTAPPKDEGRARRCGESRP